MTSTWAPPDLTAYLDGTIPPPPPPQFMYRSDGKALLYPGKVHTIHGEPESGKSMLMLAVIKETIMNGQHALLLDFESSAQVVSDRLLKLGATKEVILRYFRYVSPESDPVTGSSDLNPDREQWNYLLAAKFALVVIDGVTEAFAVFGVNSNSNDEVTAWGRKVPRKIADKTGAAVVLVDHVTKETEGRGRFAIGAQAKLSLLTGAAYSVEVLDPMGVGMKGQLLIRVGKDRDGLVRGNGGAWRRGDRTQPIALASLNSTESGQIQYQLDPPCFQKAPEAQLEKLKMNVVQAIGDAPGSSFNTVSGRVGGRKGAVRDCIRDLASDGYVRIEDGPNRTKRHFLTEMNYSPSKAVGTTQMGRGG